MPSVGQSAYGGPGRGLGRAAWGGLLGGGPRGWGPSSSKTDTNGRAAPEAWPLPLRGPACVGERRGLSLSLGDPGDARLSPLGPVALGPSGHSVNAARPKGSQDTSVLGGRWAWASPAPRGGRAPCTHVWERRGREGAVGACRASRSGPAGSVGVSRRTPQGPGISWQSCRAAGRGPPRRAAIPYLSGDAVILASGCCIPAKGWA